MNAKIKSGHKYLFSEGCSNRWINLTNEMIINFADKYTYRSFKQVKNHLLISLQEGIPYVIDIVFTSEVPKLEFDFFEKDQLVLKIK